MLNRVVSRILQVLIITGLIASCAKISAPSGGLRDKTPPVMVKSTPVNGVKNFRGDKIEIQFNEYIVLDNITEKFIVSPPMKKKPRVVIRGKSVVVELDEKLKDSTTYTFNFQDAIKDLNEGNVLQHFQFVLATGPVIDSLSVTGNIYNADNLEVPEKTQILLYTEQADSAVKKHLPEYITRADPTGYFRLDNLRPGTYRIYGLKDADNSNNYNVADEPFAFLDSAIEVTAARNYISPSKTIDTVSEKKNTKPSKPAVQKKPATGTQKTKTSTQTAKDTVTIKTIIGEHRLFLFTGKKKAHYLMGSHRDSRYQLLYVLSLPPDTMSLDFSIPGTAPSSYLLEPGHNRDSLKVWLKDSTLYSQSPISTIIRYPFTDSLGILGYKQDTIQMRFLAPKAPARNAKVKKTPFTVETNIQGGSLKPGQSIVFKSKTPFRPPDTTKIRLYETLAAGKRKMAYSFLKDSLLSTRYFLSTNLSVGGKYLFIADKGAFGNLYKESSDSVGIKFTVKDPESYGKLNLTVKNYDGNRILQLLDKTERLIAEVYMLKDGKITIPLLDPGTYRLKVIYDINGDKKWTTGDFDTKRQPEPVSYFHSEIDLKTGWQLDQEWDIGLKNFKNPKLLEQKKK